MANAITSQAVDTDAQGNLSEEDIVREATRWHSIRNERDHTWRAFDGHDYEGIQVNYPPSRTWMTEGWSAQHSETCRACSDPDSEGYYSDGML